MPNVTIDLKLNNILFDPYTTPNTLKFSINWQAANPSFQGGVQAQGEIGEVADEENGIFETVEDAIEYHKAAKLTELVNYLNGGDLAQYFDFIEGGFSTVDEAVSEQLDAKQDLIEPMDEIEDATENLADVTAKLNALLSSLKAKGLMEDPE